MSNTPSVMKSGKTFRRVTFLKLMISLIILGFLIYHTVLWHSNGMQLTMFQWIKTDKQYIAVLYNLGLIAAIAAALGILMGNIGDIISPKHRNEVKDNDNGKGAAKP